MARKVSLFGTHSQRRSFAFGACTAFAFIGVIWIDVAVSAWRCNEQYAHISPNTRCVSGHSSYTKAYEEFETELTQWIDKEKAKGDIDDAAVYFRDMQNGPWFGVRESERFLPASLFKVPVMIATLKAAEKQPGFLQEMITTPPVLPDMADGTDNPDHMLRPSTAYSVDDLLHRMIAYSDNLSMGALVQRLDAPDNSTDAARKIYSDLGLLVAEDAQTISVKSYATLFRILYNARYLSRDYSEKALALLAESEFKAGLVAGVPSGIVVAHKFGVHNLDGNRLLHDCGIVYHPVRPYLLCVMTRGESIDKSVAFIAELSRRVYSQVEQNIVKTW